jgi:hypothetical protein
MLTNLAGSSLNLFDGETNDSSRTDAWRLFRQTVTDRAEFES